MKTGIEHLLVSNRPVTKRELGQSNTLKSADSPRKSPRAHINFIPSAEELELLIRNAKTALSRGIFWDRGAIINLVL